MEEVKKKCPYCGEEIMAVAKKCKHCGEWIDESKVTNALQMSQKEEISVSASSKENVKSPSKSVLSLSLNIMIGILTIGALVLSGMYYKAINTHELTFQEKDSILLQELIDYKLSTNTDEIDAYAFGLASSTGIDEYIANLNMDSTSYDKIALGIIESTLGNDSTRDYTYYTGLIIGEQFVSEKLPEVTKQIYGEKTTTELSPLNAARGFIDGFLSNTNVMTFEEASELVNQRIVETNKK